MNKKTNCEHCAHYAYDDEYDCWCCEINLDEDEMVHFLSGTVENCNYFQLYDEYGIVRKQN